MESSSSPWTESEFLTYLLLYCAQSDFIESEEEHKIIAEKTSEEDYQKIHEEIDDDNDYVSIQKIANYLRTHHHSKGDMALIKESMKELFTSDGEYDILESNMFRVLDKILDNANK